MIEHIRQGKAELSAVYVNPTDLLDEDTFRWPVNLAVNLVRPFVFPGETSQYVRDNNVFSFRSLFTSS